MNIINELKNLAYSLPNKEDVNLSELCPVLQSAIKNSDPNVIKYHLSDDHFYADMTRVTTFE